MIHVLMKWLEPSIKKSISDATEECCSNAEVERLYNRYKTTMSKLYLLIPDNNEIIDELESMYNLNSKLVIEITHRSGIEKGINLAIGLNWHR